MCRCVSASHAYNGVSVQGIYVNECMSSLCVYLYKCEVGVCAYIFIYKHEALNLCCFQCHHVCF